MKILKKIGIFLVLFFIVLQFFRPEQNTSNQVHSKAFISETNPSESVALILQQSCYDCHSNNTNYPWYNNISPVSYWLSSHINDGKKHLNFSEWKAYSKGQKAYKLEEVIETLEEQEMPLTEYTWTHKDAKLKENEKKMVIEWAERTIALYQLNDLPQ